jgi:cellulose synthase/poly-beta-1,6-N-acetylglucosamine synthase-like glycosyltransferase
VIFVYIGVSVIYLLFFAIAGRLGRIRRYTTHPNKASIAVLVPTYQDDSVIIETTKRVLEQNYPASKFTVTVIADGLQPETIAQLKMYPINLVEVAFDVSMKAKSLNQAFQILKEDDYDLALILDADNVMSSDALEKINHAYRDGWRVIQCHRTAKNLNTSVAILDAISEEVNNTIFRRGHRAVGLSCTLIGSGMAFEYKLLKRIFSLPGILNNPGEDREVDIELVKEDIIVQYLDDAYVYDEKVQRKEVFQKQRTRWIATQVDQIRRFLKKDILVKFKSKTYLNKFFQNFLLPRLLFALLFIIIFLTAVLGIVLDSPILYPSFMWWVLLLVMYSFALIFAIPKSFYNAKTLNAFFQIPVLMLSMLKAIFHMRKNKKGFIHTPKEFTQP